MAIAARDATRRQPPGQQADGCRRWRYMWPEVVDELQRKAESNSNCEAVMVMIILACRKRRLIVLCKEVADRF